MKKQVVFIMTDTTRKDMLGCYGDSRMKTPYLDNLAAQGLKYENAYTCQPVCGPARASIFTGTFPHTNGMVTNSIAIGDNVKTIGKRLADNGIHCGYIGKWHLDGSDYFGNGFCADGFDEEYWYDMRRYLEEMSEEDRLKSRKSETAYEPDFSEEFTYAHKCSTRALSFLQNNKDEDFFLTVSYDEPHGPCLCPAPYNTMYDGISFLRSENHGDDLSKKPMMQQIWAAGGIDKSAEELNAPSKQLSLFLGCNSFVDYEIGRVLQEVEKLVPNALVIFTSDHGDMCGNHRLQMKNATCYKEVANIPLIIKGGAKGVVNAPASHIDIVPTVLDYMGIKIPSLLEGKSMMPQIKNPQITINDAVFTEFTRYEVDHDGFGGLQMMRAITTEKFKLVIHLLDTDEFYNLQTDKAEVNNLINDKAFEKERNELHDKLLQHMNDTRDLYRGYQWAVRPWRADKAPTWENDGYTRQRVNTEYEPMQLDYDTGLPIKEAVRYKLRYDEKK